jgi:tRNA 2-thiouridine synthesizing protein A
MRRRTGPSGGHHVKVRLSLRRSRQEVISEQPVVRPSVAAAAVPVAAVTIHALGRKCPIPIIMLAEQIRDVPVNGVIAVLADDPAAYTDIPSWCAMKSHEFAGSQELPGGGWALFIRRGY